VFVVDSWNDRGSAEVVTPHTRKPHIGTVNKIGMDLKAPIMEQVLPMGHLAFGKLAL
jgi:hypothetical protein